MRAEPASEFQKALVVLACCGKLHPADTAGDGDDGIPAQAERHGVSQNTAARLAVICADVQSRDRGRGQQDQFVLM